MDRRHLRPPDDVERDGLVGVAAEALHFEVMVAGVQRVTEDRGRLGRTLVAEHPHVPGLAACRLACGLPQRAPLSPGANCRRCVLGTWWSWPEDAPPIGARASR